MAYDSDLDASGGFVGDDPRRAPTFAPPNGLNIPPGYDFDPMTGRIIWVGGTDPATGQPYQPATFNPSGGQTYNPNAPDDTLGWTNPSASGTGGGGPTGGPGPTGAPNPSAPMGSNTGQEFSFPQFQPGALPNQLAPSGKLPFTPFSFRDYKPLSLEEAGSEPGFGFAMEQGRKALENSAAARGVLRTGGTLKDLFSWGNRFGEQNYQNADTRNFRNWEADRNNAFGSWVANTEGASDTFKTNYGMDRDVNQSGLDIFDRDFNNRAATFNPQFEASRIKFADLFNRWNAKLNSLTSLAGNPG